MIMIEKRATMTGPHPRKRAAAILLGLGMLLFTWLTPVTALAGQGTSNPMEVSVDVTEVSISPSPCSVGAVNVAMTNTGSEPIYGDTLVQSDDLDLSSHIISSYLPAGYTFVERVQIRATEETDPGDHEITVTSGDSVATVVVHVTDGDFGDNVARTGAPSASSTYAGRPPCGAIDGNTDSEQWSAGVGWSDRTNAEFPDWWQVDFAEPTEVARVDLYTLDSAALPADTQGLSDWEIQVPDGDAWRTVATVTGNTAGMVSTTFPSETTTSIRILCTAANGSYSRIVELEAYAA